jgi:rod shape-determining protein MreC
MPELRHSRSALVILVLASVGLLILSHRGDREGSTGTLALIQRGTTTVVAPIQEEFAAILRPVGGVFVGIGRLGRIRAENESLRADLAQAEQRRVSLAELERENAELRGLIGMRAQIRGRTVAAQVVSSPPGAFAWRVLIDAGADQGVVTGMAVVNGDGLVGRIVEVTGRYSWVELATSPTAGYAARIAQNGETGVLSGRGREPLQLEVYDAEAQLPPEAEIVTQSYAGSRIPDGLPVGRVSSPPGGLAQATRFIQVQPYADFTALGAVLVVLDVPPQPATLPLDQVVLDPNPPRPPPPGTLGDPGAPASPKGRE